MSRTLAIIKPDAMRQKLAGPMLMRIEQDGFVIDEMRLVGLTLDVASDLYAEHAKKPFFHDLCDFMCSRPVVVMVLRREDAVSYWRKVLGATDPREARRAGLFFAGGRTLRDLYGNQDGLIWQNVAHGSATDDSASREINLFFGGDDPPLFVGST